MLNIRFSIAKAAALVPESYKCKVSIPWNVHLVSSVAVLGTRGLHCTLLLLKAMLAMLNKAELS